MSIAREQPRTRNNSLWIAAAIAALVIAALAIFAFQRTRPQSAAVTRRDLVAAVPVEGDVVVPPDERADMYAPFQAPVAKVYTTVGANVDRGDVLVELQVPNAQTAYQEARNRVQEAETALANAERQYDASISAAKQRFEAARAAERAALQPPAVSVETPDGETAVNVAPTGADATAASQARIDAELALSAEQAAKAAGVAPFRRQLETARAYFEEAKSGRKMGMIRAPISGTVLALNAQAGAMVGEDRKNPVVTVVDLDELELQGEIDPRQASAVKAGMPVAVTVAEVPNEQFEGRVHSITTRPGGLLKNKTEYLAVIHLKNKGGQVKPGMKAAAAVELKEIKDVLAVPNDAIHQDSEGRPVIKVMVNNQWDDRVVEIGLSDGHYTEIKSGLKEGDIVQVKKDLL